MDLRKMTVKDCAEQLKVSERTARKYLSDIKEHFDTKIVTMEHLKRYLSL